MNELIHTEIEHIVHDLSKILGAFMTASEHIANDQRRAIAIAMQQDAVWQLNVVYERLKSLKEKAEG